MNFLLISDKIITILFLIKFNFSDKSIGICVPGMK